MPLTWKDRIKVAVASGGTGTLTLGSAASGYRTFAAGDDGKLFSYVIENGTAWETGYGTYTHSGTTFARTSRTDSSSGSAIDAGTGNLYVDMVAFNATNLTTISQTYISGLLVTKNSGGNTLDISAGSCFDPSSNKVITYNGATGVSAGSLGASQWNQVYIYDSSGTATIEVTNNANPPSTTYAGTARKGGTNSNRRWIGSFLTDGSSNIKGAQTTIEISGGAVLVVWKTTNTYDTPHRVLSSGTATTFTSISLASVAPRYAVSEVFGLLVLGYSTTGASDITSGWSIDGTNQCQTLRAYVYSAAAGIPVVPIWVLVEPDTPQVYYKLTAISPGVGPTASLDIQAYKVSR